MLQIDYARRAMLAIVLSIASASSLTGIARADADDAAPGVARISVASGDVALRHSQDGDPVAVTSNAPVEAGDYLSTGDGSRAEIQLDENDVLRADSNAQVRFTQLDESAQVAQLATGTVELRTYSGAGHTTVQTPSADVNADDTGSYLVTVDDSGNTEVTARTGRVTINTPQGSQDVESGRTIEITGSASDPQYQFVDAPSFGDFDRWADDRDREYLQVASVDYPYENVNNSIVGANDLDADGHWSDVQGYGEVWQPDDVAANWTPYSNGSWAYEPYYGYTWVGNEPWAWAPYHYGRWFYANNVGWAWDPGPRYVQPVWSPALVAFFGFGGGSGLSLSFGNVGWVPLGPRDPWHPWWGHGGGNTIVYNNTTIINNYSNYNRGFVGLPIVGWRNGDFSHIQRLRPEDVHNVRVIAGRDPVAPTARNYTFGNRPVAVNNFRKPEFARFTAINTNRNGAQRFPQSTRVIAPPQHATTTWQRFRAAPIERAQQPRTTIAEPRSVAEPQRTNTTWQRFNSAPIERAQPRTVTEPQRSTYRQPEVQRPTYQRPTYQRPTYQQPSYLRPTVQRQPEQRQPEQRVPESRPNRPAPAPPRPDQRPHKPGLNEG